MKMEHYLSHTDYPIWQVIQNRNCPVFVTTDTNGMIKVLPPKTTEEVVARERERKARTTLLMALPEDHLAKFHKMADAKEMWEAIKTRFGGNDESKKMQKYLLKQQFEGFSVSTSEGLHKGYDRVFERNVKGTTTSSSNTHNVMFVSANNTSSTNDVSTAYSVFSPSVSKSQKKGSSSYTDEVIHSFFVAMISMRIKKFYKKTGRKLQFDTKDPVGFTKVECFNCHKIGHFARAKGNHDSRRRDVGYNGNKTRENGRRPAYQDESKALVTIDGEDIDWSGHVEDDTQNYAMMAYSSSNSGSDDEVKSCSKACKESYARLKKMYNEQRDKLGDASVEITAYTLALKRLLNTQMSGNDKFGLRYGDYRYGSILSYENEVLHNVVMNKASDLENTPVNDRYADEMHAVPSPMTGNYMPSGPDIEIDYSKFTYGPKQTSADESDSKPSEYASCEFDSCVETSTSMPEPVENASKVVYKPKVWTDAPIIEEYESDSDNNSMSNDDLHRALKDKGIVDSGCSRHMTGNKAHLADYQEFKGGSVGFGGSNGRITSKGKINAGSFNLKNIDPSKDLACLFAKASIDESNKWHRRLGHVNFKNLNKLVKGNLVRGLPSKIFKNDHTCVACQKEKQYKASYLFLPTTFWAEAVNTACYVLNRVLVTKPQNKTPYELLTGKQPIISYLRPFGCHVTILNTIDQVGKFDGKSDSGFLVGYSLNSKAFRVYNLETKRVMENLHVNFIENKPNVAGKRNAWIFDLDNLTNSMNYQPVSVENQANKSAGPKEANNSAGTQANDDQAESPRKEATHDIKNASTSSTNLINTTSTPLSTAGPLRAFNDGELSYPDDPLMPHLEDIMSVQVKGFLLMMMKVW
nr:ribonuclease H-like domain-containing protein [Tanacetum cinerariifolium]